MGKCDKIENTCGKKMSAHCVDFEGEVNPESSLINDDCLNISKTTQDIYDQIEQLQESIDLSDLGNDCLTYTQADPLKLKVKEALKTIEEKVCELALALPDKNLPSYCNPIFEEIIDCVGLDYVCLTDPCNNTISTLKELLQALITKVCLISGEAYEPPVIYTAWADDDAGTGFTLTPSNSCYYATTNTVVTSGLPIASDFVGKWFRINQPVLRYEKGKYLNVTQVVGAPYAVSNLFSPAIPSFTVPFDFFESTESLLEFEVNTSITYTGVNVSNIKLYIQINGNQLELVETPVGPFPHVINSKVKLYRINTTDIGVTCTSAIYTLGSTDTNFIVNYVTSVTAGTGITIKLSEYWSDIANANITVVSQSIKSFDPNKITC